MRFQRWRHRWRWRHALVIAEIWRIAVYAALSVLQLTEHVGKIALYIILVQVGPLHFRLRLSIGHFSIHADFSRIIGAYFSSDFRILSRRTLRSVNLSLHRHCFLPLINWRGLGGRSPFFGRPQFDIVGFSERDLIEEKLDGFSIGSFEKLFLVMRLVDWDSRLKNFLRCDDPVIKNIIWSGWS